MNIVLEALEMLYEWATHGVDSYGLYLMKDNKQIVLKALKRNEPMKPIKDKEDHRCPKCAHIVDNHYCSDCGQALDWGKENE